MMGVYYLCAAGMNVLVGYAGRSPSDRPGSSRRRLCGGAPDHELRSQSLDGTCRGRGGGGSLRRPDRLAVLRVRGPYLAMVTLAFGIVVEKLVSEWTEVFGGTGDLRHQAARDRRHAFSNLHWVWFAIALGAVTHLLLRNLLRRYGRAFLSLQADEIAAESVGVSVYRYKILAFVIAAVTCGIAGAMVAQQNQYLNSDFITFHLSIFILLLVLFGGSGNLYGPLIGAVLLTLIDALWRGGPRSSTSPMAPCCCSPSTSCRTGSRAF